MLRPGVAMLPVWMSRRGRRAPGKNGYGQIWHARYGRRVGPMKHPATWLAILDGQHARFIAHDAHGFYTFRTRASHTSGLLTVALVRVASHRDVHAREKRRFAAIIAAELNNAAAQRLFAHLVLAGPSRTLRAVEEALDAAVRHRVAGRVNRDLVTVPDQDLSAYFPAWPMVW